MIKLCLYDISNHKNFNQNRSINYARMMFAERCSNITLDDLQGKVILRFIKNLCLNNVDSLEKF